MNKDEIINSYDKSQFLNFLENDYEGKILKLFDQEGINLLRKCKNKTERITYILNYSRYKEQLLQNKEFVDILLNSDVSSYYASLHNISNKTYDFMLNQAISTYDDMDDISSLFNYFDDSYKLKKIENTPFSNELIYSILRKANVEVIQKIIEIYDIDLIESKVYIPGFFSNAKSSVLIAQKERNLYNHNKTSISVPPRLITNRLAQTIYEKYDIYRVRSIINDMQYSTDPSVINNFVKEKEDSFINNFDENKLLSPYDELFAAFSNMKEKEDSLEYGDLRRKFVSIIRKMDDKEFYNKIEMKYENGGLEQVLEYLKKICSNKLSDYIVDYHFEENYYNVMLDIGELLRFYNDGNIKLDEEKVKLYEQILNIDKLSVEERKQLHNSLKNINIIEIFYDDMSYARTIVNEAIKDYSISSEKLKEYKDEELSKKYGVDVYNIGENPFFGIVKTGSHRIGKLPEGHSFSLVGKNAVGIYGNIEDSNTFLYDSSTLKKEQIVHVFPADSFTIYKPLESTEESTNRVNSLLKPDELIGITKSYNELLILEPGTNKTDIDKSISELKRIALYCIDNISKQDIERAKQENLGIILVSSKKYMEEVEKYRERLNKYDDTFDYNYFDGYYDKDRYEAKRNL